MTIQKLQAELDECWDRDDDRFQSSAQPETIYQLRGLLAETKKVEIFQKEHIEKLQRQLSVYQEKCESPVVLRREVRTLALYSPLVAQVRLPLYSRSVNRDNRNRSCLPG